MANKIPVGFYEETLKSDLELWTRGQHFINTWNNFNDSSCITITDHWEEYLLDDVMDTKQDPIHTIYNNICNITILYIVQYIQ